MMKWRVDGAHLETGKSVTEVIDAADYPALQYELKRRKILAEKTTEVKDSPPKAETVIRPALSPPAVNVTRGQVTAIIVLLVLGMLLPAFGLLQPILSQRWEYKVVAPNDANLKDELATYGEQGWELVTARRATGAFDDVAYEMIFKRKR